MKVPQDTVELTVIYGEDEKGNNLYLDKSHTDVTDNLADAENFGSIKEADTHFKNYVQASVLMGDSRLQNLKGSAKVRFKFLDMFFKPFRKS